MKLPPFLTNLYADLRDRRLLPVVGVLLVAIVAVPLALKRETQPPPPLDASAMAAVEGAEVPTLPAVLAADPGLRDYRERLDAMRSKNPFRQEFEASAIADAAIAGAAIADVGTTAGASDSASEPTAPIGSDSTSSGATSSPAPTETSTASVASSSSGDSGSGSKSSTKSEDESKTKTKTKEVKVAYRVDLQVGPVGEAKRRKNVKALTALPSESNPVMVFIGAGEDGKQAVFLLSHDVGETDGDGSCLPDAGDCQFLSLKPDEERRMVYGSGPESKEYVLKVVGINLVPISKDSKDSEGSEPEDSDDGDAEDEDSDSALSGIESWLGL